MTQAATRRRPGRRAIRSALFALVLALPAATAGAARAAATAAPGLGGRLSQDVAAAAQSGALVSAAVLDGAGGRLLGGYDAGARLTPGTSWAAVTGAAALWRLGPATAVESAVMGPVPRRGTVLGNLVLVGGGDPFLSAAQIGAMAASLAARVQVVTGGVLADGALFGYPQIPPGWPLSDTQGDAEPPVAALSVAGDAVTVTVAPAKTAGLPARVVESPAGLVPVTGQVATVKAAKASAGAPVFVPGASSLALSGSIAVGATPVVHVLYPPDPGRLAALLLRSDLRRDGVSVQGAVGTGAPVTGSVALAHVLSPPLSAWMPALWAPAADGGPPSPLAAEDMLRLLCGPSARSACGVPADQKQILRFLAAVGADTSTNAADGSGRALTDSASAQTLARVLYVAGLHAWGAPLFASLPPLAASLPGAPAGAIGVFSQWSGNVSLLARVPTGTAGAAGRLVALLVAGLGSPALAQKTALAVVQSAAGVAAAPPKATHQAPAAGQDVAARAAGALGAALDLAGPGAETAVTAWPVGAKAPAVNLDGDALMPATGTVPLFVAAQALPGAAATTRLTTRVVVDGTLSGTTLNGSIGLVGGLDPTLSGTALSALAQQVAALGVRRVTGGVAVDDLALPPSVPASWPWQWLGDPPAVSGDALSVGEGLYSVAVLPGRRIGASPTVEVVPASTPVAVTDEATTVSGPGQTLALWPDPTSGRLVLTGTIGLADKLGTVFLRAAPDPGLAAGRLFLQDLESAGVAMSGGVRRASIPAVAPLLARAIGPSLIALDDALLESPTPIAAWDAAAILGGALRGRAGPAAVGTGLAATAGLLLRDGRGAPPPVLSEPFGVGVDDRLSTYGCAETLAALAARQGSPDSGLPTLLPVLPDTSPGGVLHAIVGVGTGAGSLAGYFVPKSGTPIALCVSLAGLARSGDAVLPAAAAAAAAIAQSPPPAPKAKA